MTLHTKYVGIESIVKSILNAFDFHSHIDLHNTYNLTINERFIELNYSKLNFYY